MPDDEIEHLRSLLARAHENRESLARKVSQIIMARFGTGIQKKATVEYTENATDKDAA
jgi:hypothetical protein